MFNSLVKKFGPTIPIIYIDSNINQAKTAYLLKKIRRKYQYFNAEAIAVVCSI